MAEYVLYAQAGQEMEVEIVSPGGKVFLAVIGQDGTVFQNVIFQQTYWQGVLPRDQDYMLRAVAMGADTVYGLRVTIPARIPSGPQGTAYQGGSLVQRLSPQGVEIVARYLLHVFSDQEVDVVLASPNGNVLLAIRSADGMPVLRYVAESKEWHGPMFTTQDYLIDVVSVGADPSFQLSVAVSPRGSGSGPEPLPAPTPVVFLAGAISGVESGQLAPGAMQRYELRAAAGQQFIVHVWPERTVGITVEGERSGYWSEPPQVGSLVIPALPATQDYVITLSLPAAQAQTDYTIEVTIR